MSDDVERIAKGLTKAQREAMLHANAGQTSYRWARMGTLEALCARDLVGKTTGPGAFYSPQTAIKWPLTPLGLQVRQYLERNPQ